MGLHLLLGASNTTPNAVVMMLNGGSVADLSGSVQQRKQQGLRYLRKLHVMS
jgi:hypothetical protein